LQETGSLLDKSMRLAPELKSKIDSLWIILYQKKAAHLFSDFVRDLFGEGGDYHALVRAVPPLVYPRLMVQPPADDRCIPCQTGLSDFTAAGCEATLCTATVP
jgi:hypothetical protein